MTTGQVGCSYGEETLWELSVPLEGRRDTHGTVGRRTGYQLTQPPPVDWTRLGSIIERPLNYNLRSLLVRHGL